MKGYCIDDFDSSDSAKDEGFPQEYTLAEKYAQEDKERLGELKLAMPANHMPWLFQLSQDIAHHNVQVAMRVMEEHWVRLCVD